MQNKKWLKCLFVGIFVPCMLCGITAARAEDEVTPDNLDAEMETVSSDAVASYDPDGSLFQQITDLEQEKILMQLEKERAQLDLELDRLAAEKIKLHMEIDTLSGRAEQAQQELEAAKARLEAETAKLEQEKEALANKPATPSAKNNDDAEERADVNISEKFKLVNVIGAGNQLQATLEDLRTGQTKRVNVGRSVEGFVVKSISLDEGVVFEGADGNIQTLNVGGAR